MDVDQLDALGNLPRRGDAMDVDAPPQPAPPEPAVQEEQFKARGRVSHEDSWEQARAFAKKFSYPSQRNMLLREAMARSSRIELEFAAFVWVTLTKRAVKLSGEKRDRRFGIH